MLVTDNPAEAVDGTDFVYTDVWVSMGESDTDWATRVPLLPFRVTPELMAASGISTTKFMHCLTALHNTDTELGRRLHDQFGLDGAEVSNDVFESSSSIVFDQAENRLHTIKAVLVNALGGNALLRRGEKPDAAIQLDHIRSAATALAPLANEHELLICHGNGPQIGMLALESENDPALTRSYPMDVLVAQTQGMIGYWLVQSLANAGVTKPVLGVITETVVDPADPAFLHPTKFVGPNYTEQRARQLAAQHSWEIAQDGSTWRRVVPSTAPLRIVEQHIITALLERQVVLVCAGGAGIPVTDRPGIPAPSKSPQ